MSEEPEREDKPEADKRGKVKSDKKKKPQKKKKAKFVDDGRTIYSMEGLSKHPSPKDKESVGLSKKEKRAAIKAAFKQYLPMFLGVLACFSIAILLVYLWLS